ncbi:MAG TPA: hypothetical protein VFH40_07430 [Gemmatimonadales bacterium]|nr:hypothetical protein [Gemmatimonadales bacterium]
MRNQVVGFMALVVAQSGFTGLLAAQAAMSPPPYLQIFQEQVKVGRVGAHPATESGWPRAFAKAKIQNHYIGLTTIYGPPEAWFAAGVKSIAEIDEQNQAIEKSPGLNRELDRLAQADAANLSGYRAVLARYQKDLSNGPDINPAEMRIWEVLIFTVRPGHEGDFFQAAKLYQNLVQGAKVEAPWATYEVMSGMPGPVYLVFVPHKTLAEIDPATGTGAAIEKAMTQETMKKFGTLAEGYTSIESRIFSVSPEMSYPPPEWVSQDRSFWGKKSSP